MDSVQNIVIIVLKAVAVGLSIASIIIGFIGTLGVEIQVMMLGFALAALSVAALSKED